jgi:hypothetical protein
MSWDRDRSVVVGGDGGGFDEVRNFGFWNFKFLVLFVIRRIGDG